MYVCVRSCDIHTYRYINIHTYLYLILKELRPIRGSVKSILSIHIVSLLLLSFFPPPPPEPYAVSL